MGSKKEVIWFNGGGSLNEIYQSFDMKFSFANIDEEGKLVQCHEWVKCRDYLHDAVRTQLTGDASYIYGFRFNKKTNPNLCLSKMMMLVTNKSITNPIDFRRKLNNGIKLIHHYENMMGQDLSTITKVAGNIDKGYNHVWLVTGPKFWLTAPHLVSLFTLLLRCGISKFDLRKYKTASKALKIAAEDSQLSKNDNVYITNIHDKLDTVLKKHEELFPVTENGFSKRYYEKYSIDSFHNRAGIVNTCGCSTPFMELNNTLKECFAN